MFNAEYNLIGYIERQMLWSLRTFGPATRTAGLLDHIRKELKEVEADPTDAEEWADIVILALDGAWRHGHTPEEVADALVKKQAKNRLRKWPDWRTADPDKAIEHVEEEA